MLSRLVGFFKVLFDDLEIGEQSSRAPLAVVSLKLFLDTPQDFNARLAGVLGGNCSAVAQEYRMLVLA